MLISNLSEYICLIDVFFSKDNILNDHNQGIVGNWQFYNIQTPNKNKELFVCSFDVFILYFWLNSDFSRPDDVGQTGFKSLVVTLIFSTLKAEQQINYTISQASSK